MHTSEPSTFNWNTGAASILAKPEHCTKSQASEFAQAKRFLKKPGKAVVLEHSLPKASKPAMQRGGAQPGSGRPTLDLDLDAMRHARLSGRTWVEIAIQFGCSTFTARTRCQG